jgi:hypothetical protein
MTAIDPHAGYQEMFLYLERQGYNGVNRQDAF